MDSTQTGARTGARGGLRSALREWAIRLAMLGISLTIGLLLAEGLVRAFFPIYDGRDNLTVEGRPITDWFQPGSVYRQVSNEYDAVTTITPEGHRVPGAADPEVIFLGDSFTYGFGLTDDETFPAIYCKVQNLACANLGYPGSGTGRQLRRLEHFLDTYGWKPREVKLVFFAMSTSFSAGNDFVDNYNFGRWVQREAAAAAASATPVTGAMPTATAAQPGVVERVIGWQTGILQYSTLMRRAKYHWGPLMRSLVVADPGDRMAEALASTREQLSRLDALSRSRGFAYSIYLVVPVQDIMRGTHEQTLRALDSVSPRPAVATAPLFVESPGRFYYAYDGHLNPAGSRKVAEFMIGLDRGATSR